MAPDYDVLVAGDYCLDLIFAGPPSLPVLGEEVVARDFARLTGGTFNTAAAMHRLGLRVGWAADFGDDAFSRMALEDVRAEGLDERLFVQHDRPLRYITAAASFPHDRAFLAYYDPPPRIPAGVKALARASARLLFLPGLYLGPLIEPALALLRARGMRLAMDGPCNRPLPEHRRAAYALLRRTDVFLPSAREARELTGLEDLEQALTTLGDLCPLVVIKDGAAGAHAIAGGEIFHAPALPITPLDTTGAGDCFCAGFLCAWLEGRPLPECLRWGNAVGGLSTLGLGGTGYRVGRAEVERALAP